MANAVTHEQVKIWEKAVDSLLETGQAYHNSVTLHLFRTIYLPILADPNPKKDLSAWINLCSHPYSAVHVIDVDGSVKYVIPPLMTGMNTTVVRGDQPSMDGVMTTAMQHIARSPREGEQFLRKVMDGRIAKNEHIAASRVELNKVLVAEGYSPIVIPGTVNYTGIGNVGKSSGSAVGPDTEETFDDL